MPFQELHQDGKTGTAGTFTIVAGPQQKSRRIIRSIYLYAAVGDTFVLQLKNGANARRLRRAALALNADVQFPAAGHLLVLDSPDQSIELVTVLDNSIEWVTVYGDAS